MRLSEDDVIKRSHKTYKNFFNIEFNFFNSKYKKEFKDYFNKELNRLKHFEEDGLLKISDNNIVLTPLGEHFSPQIANVFDMYNDQEYYKRNNFNII